MVLADGGSTADISSRRSRFSGGEKRPVFRIVLAGLWVILGVISGLVYVADRALRKEAITVGEKYRFDVRRPVVLAEMEVAPAGDLAIQWAGSGVVADLLVPQPWAALPFEDRQIWLESIQKFDEELKDVESLLLRALAVRPGWAYHRFLLGQVVYVRDRRRGLKERPVEMWDRPLALAMRGAPGDEVIAAFRAGAWLESWDSLPADVKKGASGLFRSAFLDAGFVARGFLPAQAVLGTDAVMALLPEDTQSLRQARDAMRKTGDVAAVAVLQERWAKAEIAEREAELAYLERRAEIGDRVGLRGGCSSFAARHKIGDLDRPEERARFSRLLQLWPADKTGTWRTDPRGEIVRFFLEGRSQSVDGHALARAASMLTSIPESVQARVALLARDRYLWRQLVKQSEEAGMFRWTPFFTDLAWAELKSGRVEEAAEALGRIAPLAQDECDVLLARRAVESARGNQTAREVVSEALVRARPLEFLESDWSQKGLLSLCVDPEADGHRSLAVQLVAGGPVLVSWGWDGGTTGWRYVTGVETLLVPLTGISGRRVFFLESLAGPRVMASRTWIVSSGETVAAAEPKTAASVTGMAGSDMLKSTSP